MNTAHFTDERIEEVTSGRIPLTQEERDFLVSDTPRYEECSRAKSDLEQMSDKDLMNTAFWVWSDFCR